MTQRLLRRAGLEPNDFYFGSVYEPDLRQQIQAKGIHTVVVLGEKALNRILGENEILRWRGRAVEYPHLPGVWVVPTFLPSKLMQKKAPSNPSIAPSEDMLRHPPRFHGIWMRDIHFALHIAREGFSRTDGFYLEDPDPLIFDKFADEYFAALNDDVETMLSWDIETPYKAKNSEDEEELDEKENIFDGVILRVSFCFKPGYAISVPWSSRYESTIRRLLKTRGPMVVWNGRTFDVPVVQREGYEVLGVVMDFMDGYHLLQSDLPKGLEWVTAEASNLLPWKHLAQAKPALYSAIDADAALRNAIYIREELKKTGQWELFLRHVVELMPLLDLAGTQGNLTDPEVRNEIRGRLIAMRDELVAEIQPYVPRELFPRKRYERLPDALEGTEDRDGHSWPTRGEKAPARATGKDGSDWDVIFEVEDVNTCSHCRLIATNKSEHFKGSPGPPNPKTGKPTRVKNPCKEAGAEIRKEQWFVPRFLQVLPFNPNSSDQLKAYMRHFGHPIGTDKRDSSKETADAAHLKTLVKKYGQKFPLYASTLVIHKAGKTIGTYTPEADANNFLHTQYVNSTSTWRLGSRKVPFGTQMQNWGKKEENVYAIEARKQIIARSGHKLVQIDSSAVEAVLQGHYMNDVEYMLTASKSIHAWLCCKELGYEFNPESVEKVKKEHKSLYNKMKTVNYLTNFGGGAKLMTDTFPETFPTRKSAEDAQELLYALLPTLKTYHHQVRWEAHTKTFLQSPWGYRHYYYDVFKQDRDGNITLGKDGKRCVAFKPQNSNAAFQKDNLLFIKNSKFGIYVAANLSVHDSCCLDVPDSLVDECVEFLMSVFTRPIPEMRNLRVGAEVEVGSNWGVYDETNPGGMHGVHKVVVDDYTFEHTESGLLMPAAA